MYFIIFIYYLFISGPTSIYFIYFGPNIYLLYLFQAQHQLSYKNLSLSEIVLTDFYLNVLRIYQLFINFIYLFISGPTNAYRQIELQVLELNRQFTYYLCSIVSLSDAMLLNLENCSLCFEIAGLCSSLERLEDHLTVGL